jgi:hypothetical protein
MSEPLDQSTQVQVKKVGQGLVGVDIDVSKMSPRTLQLYREREQIANDDSPGDDVAHAKAITNADHALQGAINKDILTREMNKRNFIKKQSTISAPQEKVAAALQEAENHPVYIDLLTSVAEAWINVVQEPTFKFLGKLDEYWPLDDQVQTDQIQEFLSGIQNLVIENDKDSRQLLHDVALFLRVKKGFPNLTVRAALEAAYIKQK